MADAHADRLMRMPSPPYAHASAAGVVHGMAQSALSRSRSTTNPCHIAVLVSALSLCGLQPSRKRSRGLIRFLKPTHWQVVRSTHHLQELPKSFPLLPTTRGVVEMAYWRARRAVHRAGTNAVIYARRPEVTQMRRPSSTRS